MATLLSAAARMLSLPRHWSTGLNHTLTCGTRFEALEGRQLFAVSADAAGFTVVTPGGTDRAVYVSSAAGNDANTGLSPAAPVKTIAKASGLVRAGTGDQMLLRRGDTWYESLGTWIKSGRSADEPMVIGTYGAGDRPVLATGNAAGLTTGRASFPRVTNLVVQGLKFYAHTRDPANPAFDGGWSAPEGLRLLAATDNLLVEDCAVDGYKTNITIQPYFGPVTNVRVRRSVVTDAYNRSGHAQGLYADKVSNVTLEENVFDHNGWVEGPGAVASTMYNHNVYIKETVPGFVARGNLLANASSHGMQARSGGVIENNTFLNNPIGLSFGMVNGSPAAAGGVSGRVTNNVFLGGGSIAGGARGWGIEVSNLRPGGNTSISGNVFANGMAGGGYAIYLAVGNVSNPSQAYGVNDLTIEGNVVYNWTRGLNIYNSLVSGGDGYTGLNDVTIRDNDFQRIGATTVLWAGNDFTPDQIRMAGNRYNSAAGAVVVNTGGPASTWAKWAPGRDVDSAETAAGYSDATRTAGSYAALAGTGGSTDAAYVAAARGLSGSGWNAALLGSALADYVRTGFDLSAGAGTAASTGGTVTTTDPGPAPVGRVSVGRPPRVLA